MRRPLWPVHRVPIHDLAARPPRRLKYWSSVARTEVSRLPGTRTLAATLFVSLDGVVESPEKWSFPFWSEETQRFKLDETRASDALLLGRVTYEGFAAAWPGRKDPDGCAGQFNSIAKLVESTTFSKGVVKLVYRPADKASRAKRTGTARPKRNTKRRKA